MKKGGGKKRASKYEAKLELKDDVEFDDLFKVAINHKQPEKKPTVKKKK